MVAAGRRRPAWVERERRRVLRELRAGAGPSGIASLQSYLGSPVPVLGVSVPYLRRVGSAAAHRIQGRSPQEARALVRSLWEGASFEEKEVAIELLGRPPLIDHEVGWRLGVRWVDAATGWALSDSLASGPIATEVAAHPERFAELLRWTSSKNFWRRRASAYALRAWVLAGELDRPFALLSRLLEDPERWVQRAVGTWLRECWKKDRARTERFLRREVRRLAPVTITVATERAPKSFREELRRSKGRRRVERRGY
ncbi:MAG: DNA alkylation repair protein [Thermoplasmata archaeon]